MQGKPEIMQVPRLRDASVCSGNGADLQGWIPAAG